MTSPYDYPTAPTGAAPPAPRPPFDPWAPPPKQRSVGEPPRQGSGQAAGQAWPVTVEEPAPAASRADDFVPPGSVHDAPPPGYAYAPAMSSSPHGSPPEWGGWDAQPRRGTNGLAVASFIISWFFWPVALVMGLVALLSKRRQRQSGRGWAIAGIALSITWAVVSVLLAAAVLSLLGGGQLAALTAASRGTAGDLQGVAVGQCFLEQDNNVAPVECALPHQGEVFFTGSLVGTGTVGYPGEPLLQAEAETVCTAAFASYVGLPYEASQWDYDTWVPSEASWADGDRAATCAVVPSEGDTLVGVAAASGI